MLTLNHQDTRPLYEQIRDSLRRLIIGGAMGADEQLPSVRQLAAQLAINPNTIQRAYNELEREGTIYSVPGKGSYASPGRRADPRRRQQLAEKISEAATELKFMGVPPEDIGKIIEEVYAHD